MKKTNVFERILSAMVCLVLIAALALSMTACQKTDAERTGSTASATEVTELGEGKTAFSLTVVHKDGSQKQFSVKTDETTVGAALLKEELIAGDEGQYGLYVKTVDGETLDYNTDGYYWSFYIGDTYAQTGVDQTELSDGETYTLKAEK
ncbi:MAG: DUF4430 domain-containing protein [Clostridia bacterium]|nr:DUF4430 domain-containing protein [Clostridia bacterium]